jgi:ethanolaminephosphotransferase
MAQGLRGIWAVIYGDGVISAEGLESIANHKYKSGQYTPLDNLFNPMWMWLTECLPAWLAPNLVTLLGFIPMAVCYMLVWIYSADVLTPVPRWLALLVAVSGFFYQTMDAMDGKQARRTGASSPMGQLFDHGCDCLACLSHHCTAHICCLAGPSRLYVGTLSAFQFGFLLAQWQERYTGVMPTGVGPVGVTEAQYFLMVLALLAALGGPEPVLGATARENICSGFLIFMVPMAAIVVTQTLQEARKTSTSRLVEASRDLLPALAVFVMSLLVPLHTLEYSPRGVCLLSGLLFFYYTAQMIVFSMAHMPYPVLQPTLLVFAALVGLSYALPSRVFEVHLAFSASTCAVGALVARWVVVVIAELKCKLGINIFSISKASTSGTKTS